jgi:hypothetical protein
MLVVLLAMVSLQSAVLIAAGKLAGGSVAGKPEAADARTVVGRGYR